VIRSKSDTPLHEIVVHVASKVGEANDAGECYPRTRDFIRQKALNGELTIWGKQQFSTGSESTWRFDACLVEIPAEYWKTHRFSAVAFATREPRKPVNANIPYTLPLRRDHSNPKGWENAYADLYVNRQQVFEQPNRSESSSEQAKEMTQDQRSSPYPVMADDDVNTALALPAEPRAKMKSPKPIERGKFCQQVIDEIKRIRNLSVGTGRSVAEIQNDYPDFVVWKIRESLDREDQDTFTHPNRWGPSVGYAQGVLSKIHDVSTHTINSWAKAYRKSLQMKKR
jgi:hypothetical protein